MRAAHFHLRQGEHRQGLQLMARAIAGNPVFADAAFDTYRNSELPLADILEFGLSGRASAEAYFRKLLADGNTAHAALAWDWMRAKGWGDQQAANDYIAALVRTKQYETAARFWASLRESVGDDGGDASHVHNGDFESALTGSTFDWSLRNRPGVAVTLDPRVSFSGARSARLEFDGSENVTTIGLSQSVYLPPGRYRLQARVKVHAITTREGIGLELTGQGVRERTDHLVGSSEWVPVDRLFEVPADAGLLQLRAFRERSFRFDNLIKGTAWIDQVRITKVEPGP
jgi:hypothetical protein